MKITLKNIFGPMAVVASVGACVPTTSSHYSEGPDYNGQRTPIQHQPMRCDVYTSEVGQVYGGTTTFNGGTAVRNCVSTPAPQQAQQAIEDVTTIIYQAQGLVNALNM